MRPFEGVTFTQHIEDEGTVRVIALPGAVFFNDWWMGMYPNRAELTAGVVAGPAILLLALALATVATQSARAALTNPVESLNYE